MLETLIGITSSVYFSIGTGILLLWLFFCILKAVDSPNRRKWGFIFLIGLLGFSLNFFYTQVIQHRYRTVDAEEVTLTVLPETDTSTHAPIPLTKQDVKEACDTLEMRLHAQEIRNAQLSYSGNKIRILIPFLHRNEEQNREMMDVLTAKLTHRARLMLLKVHPDSYNIYRNDDYIRKIGEYTAALHRYSNAEERALHDPSYKSTEKHPSKTNLRHLPQSLGMRGYQLVVEQMINEDLGEPITTEDGRFVYDYEILQTPVAAQLEGIYICDRHIEKATPHHPNYDMAYSSFPLDEQRTVIVDGLNIHVRDARTGKFLPPNDEELLEITRRHKEIVDKASNSRIDITLTDEGARRMHKLTSSLNLGYDRLGIVINNILKCAPVVQSVLDKDFNISGLNGKDEAKMLAEAFTNPLFHDLKVEKRCETTIKKHYTKYNLKALYSLMGLLGFLGICYFGHRFRNRRKQA